ncbi:MAG: cyclase family protein [Chloroflexi bacterium]|nr:cyclase family protein [Chloroflexota bacterium]
MREKNKVKIHDISISISEKMPTYPGDPGVRVEPMLEIAHGATANVSRISFGTHTGTHIDPPAHFIRGGKTIDQLDLTVLYGPARVIDFTRVKRAITARDLERAKLHTRAVRILFKTRNSKLWQRPGFQTDFVAFSADAAEWLVARGVKLIGIDYLSAELMHASEPRAHRVLLGAGVVIVEGLNLKNIAPGNYTLACLPLKIKNGDGAPARAILIQ